MYPDLSYLFHDLFGTAPDNWTAIFKTFGLFLALSFFAAGYVFRAEIKRMENLGFLDKIKFKNRKNKANIYRELVVNVVIAFFVGWKIPYIYQNFEPFKSDPASLVFGSGGNIWTGVIISIIIFSLLYFDLKKMDLSKEPSFKLVWPHTKISDMVIVFALSGIIGAKLFAISENLDAFYNDPLGQLFSGSGLTVYGGLIVGVTIGVYYIRKLGLPVLRIMDAAAPAMVMGALVGRMGCQFSGDGDWGKVNAAATPDWWFLPEWVWSYSYPHNVTKSGVKLPDCAFEYCWELSPGVFPTPIYEVLMSLIAFAILWTLRSKFKKTGYLFSLYLILTGIARFLVEFLRVNDHYEFLGFSGSQAHYISLVFIILGLVGIGILSKSKAQNR